MKKFRKTKDELFICEECRRTFIKKNSLSKHINLYHISVKNYFDKWLKEEKDGFCRMCEKETVFVSLFYGYKHTCCNKKCILKLRKETNLKNYGVEHSLQSKEIREKGKQTKKERYGDENFTNREKYKETNLKNHGVENVYQTEEAKIKIKKTKFKNHGDENFTNREKYKETCLKKYDVENTFQAEIKKQIIKETNLERYGVEYPMQSKEIQEKSKQTCLRHYGVEHSLQSKEIREKSKETCLKRYGDENYNNIEKYKQTCLKHYGVEHPMQNREYFEAVHKNILILKQFENTTVWYQGSFEHDFLNEYYDMFSNEIKRGPTIKYFFENSWHNYYSDFIIPSLNLVIEIKNSHLAEVDKEVIEAKKQGTLANDYNYIMIVNMNYSEFNDLLWQNGQHSSPK
ncbi:MAG: hypothetical protein WC554_09775 [Clostridia bacterium]